LFILKALTVFNNQQKNYVDLIRPDTFDALLNENELLKKGILTEVIIMRVLEFFFSQFEILL
jgi:hypothetical protein